MGVFTAWARVGNGIPNFAKAGFKKNHGVGESRLEMEHSQMFEFTLIISSSFQ
jgi:hypothetical protein